MARYTSLHTFSRKASCLLWMWESPYLVLVGRHSYLHIERLAVTGGVFDDLSLEAIAGAKINVQKGVIEKLPELCLRILSGEKLKKEDRKVLMDTARAAINSKQENE